MSTAPEITYERVRDGLWVLETEEGERWHVQGKYVSGITQGLTRQLFLVTDVICLDAYPALTAPILLRYYPSQTTAIEAVRDWILARQASMSEREI